MCFTIEGVKRDGAVAKVIYSGYAECASREFEFFYDYEAMVGFKHQFAGTVPFFFALPVCFRQNPGVVLQFFVVEPDGGR